MSSSASSALTPPRLIDIGSNLSDPVFRGVYRGKRGHPDDWADIVQRARNAGVVGQILTGDCLAGAKESLELAKDQDGLFVTVGCHPCRADEFESFVGGPEAYLEALAEVVEANLASAGGKVVAIGECGLDFDRLEHCSKEVQLKYFPVQLTLASKYDLPLFLHSRNAHKEFLSILQAHPTKLRGVVHSHTGTLEEAQELIAAGFLIGVNGCSFKEQSGLDCVRELPLDKLLVESDCPWCEVRPSHASFPLLSLLSTSPSHSHLRPLYNPEGAVKKERWAQGKTVKSRNEPVATGQVAWIVAQLKGVSLEEVAETTFRNTEALFGIKIPEAYLTRSRSQNRYLVNCYADGCTSASGAGQKAHWRSHKLKQCPERARQKHGIEELALSHRVVPTIMELLVQFLPEFSYEIDAAMFSALNLLGSTPLNKSHCLTIVLVYNLSHPDPSLILQVEDANWCENLKKRTRVSNTVFVSGTEPKMTEREVARFKGWW
ncbi:hypothetical protein RQP46_008614 [Phenoliferia psychrophenolica]